MQLEHDDRTQKIQPIGGRRNGHKGAASFDSGQPANAEQNAGSQPTVPIGRPKPDERPANVEQNADSQPTVPIDRRKPEEHDENGKPNSTPQVTPKPGVTQPAKMVPSLHRIRSAHPAEPVVRAPRSRRAPADRAAVLEGTTSVSAVQAWGWLPALSLACASGLLLVGLADAGSRQGAAWATPLFWLSLLLMYTPVVARAAVPGVTRREHLGLVVLLAMSLYLVKVFHSPVAFTFPDEFSHWRTANDILTSGQMFSENPLLPVSAMYPGMETVAAGIVSLTGMSLFGAGIILIAAARLVIVLALFLLYELVTRSTRVAALGVIIYMANPNFIFFNADFAYESLALPIAVLILFALARRERNRELSRAGLTIVVLLAVGLVITTHHITSFALTAFLLIWTITFPFKMRSSERHPGPGAIAVLVPLASLLWMLFIATSTARYLEPHLVNTVSELAGLVTRQAQAGRELFQSGGGQVAPLWERVIGLAGVGLVTLGLPFGLFEVWRRRRNDYALALGISALAYPLSLLLRLTRHGWEISNRSSEFLFIAVGIVLALAISEQWLRLHFDWRRVLAVAAVLSVVFLSGVIAGWAPDWRLPGPYAVANGPRSIDGEGTAAAYWMRDHLGPNNPVGADATNMMLIGSYGEQFSETSLSGGVDMPWILFAPQIGPDQMALLKRGNVVYILVDKRLSAARPVAQRYYPGVLPEVVLAKFETLPNTSRILDSGNIVVYDVGRFDGVH